MQKLNKNLLLLVIIPFLYGCTSSMNIGGKPLTCKKNTQGLPCASVRQAYNAANNYNPENSLNTQKNKTGSVSAFEPKISIATDTQDISDTDTDNKSLVAPASVLKVWVNSYQDANGNLVNHGEIFTEVTPHGWRTGYKAFKDNKKSRKLSPLTIEEKQPIIMNNNNNSKSDTIDENMQNNELQFNEDMVLPPLQ